MSEPSDKAPRWAWWIATGLGSGWLRPASGTWGSLAALGLWCIATFGVTAPFLAWSSRQPPTFLHRLTGLLMEGGFLIAMILAVWVAVRACDRVVEETGRKDPGYIVVDEWIGMWLALWPLRWLIAREAHRLTGPGGWKLAVVLGLPFLAFRLFDIWKPWPIDQIQDLPAGQGIVADDLVAGLYALPLVILLEPWVSAWALR